MTYLEAINTFASRAQAKTELVSRSWHSYFVGAVLAGAYVGFGIALIFTVGHQAPIEVKKLLMGATFGIALTLVVFAGSELYTGHTLYMGLGVLTRRCSTSQLAKLWSVTWAGNLVGSVLLAALLAAGVGGQGQTLGSELLHKVAQYKMGSPGHHLLARGITCNWLICLALWMCARTKSDTTKCILIFWCLLAFITLGLEHCVANMTLLSLNILFNDQTTAAFLGSAHNLFWVTLGNTIGGAGFVGAAYWLASDRPRAPQHSES